MRQRFLQETLNDLEPCFLQETLSADKQCFLQETLARKGDALVAGKQSEWLDRVLSKDTDDELPTPHPQVAQPSTLLQRQNVLERVASGEVRQVTRLELDPGRVRIWPGNARIYENLNEANTRELLDAIIAEGCQRVPAIVRRVEGDAQHDYEVIAGTRRHWSISWLRKNHYPNLRFVALVEQLDDEAAFRLADLENRARKDVSDLERARNYRAALSDHYGGQHSRMAERLRLSKGWLSKMIKVAGISDAVLAAFEPAEDLAFFSAYPLAQAMDDRAKAKLITAEAKVIAREQGERRTSGEPPYPAPQVVKRLLTAGEGKKSAGVDEPFSVKSKHGRPLLTIRSANRQGITFRLHNGAGADEDEAISALKQALSWLESRGQGLAK